MRKLVVINSFGPMASTLVAGLVEKFGYSNVPIRKLRLHDYLMGNLALDSGVMQGRLRAILEAHSRPDTLGGVSVLDRNSQKPKVLTDISKVEKRLNAFENTVFDSIEDLYFECHKIYNDAVIYKEMKNNEGWHIELTVDFHRFDAKELCRRYDEVFSDVKIIHLRRDFRQWINALSSQAMFHPDLKQRLKFFPHMRYRDFALYEKSASESSGLHIDFDELFDTPVEALAEKISTFLGVTAPDIDFKAESYDMYSKIQPYDVAFKRFDDNVSFLSEETLNYLANKAEGGDIEKFPANLLAWQKYVFDSHRYLKEHGKQHAQK